MKKMSHKEQIEQIIELHEMLSNRIDYMWEEHLEYIKWNKNSEFYEPYIIFCMRYIWETVKEQNLEYAYTSYNRIMTYLYNNIEECEKMKKKEGISDCLYCILQDYLFERNFEHHRKFDKEYNQNLYYTH